MLNRKQNLRYQDPEIILWTYQRSSYAALISVSTTTAKPSLIIHCSSHVRSSAWSQHNNQQWHIPFTFKKKLPQVTWYAVNCQLLVELTCWSNCNVHLQCTLYSVMPDFLHNYVDIFINACYKMKYKVQYLSSSFCQIFL